VTQFCRHNRLTHACPICSREQAAPAPPPRVRARRASSPARPTRSRGLRVRQMSRGAEDGYANGLLPGLRSSADAGRLADELAWATGRLAALATDPPGLYGEAAAETDSTAALELAFLIAALGPLEGNGGGASSDPWAGIEEARRDPAALAAAPRGPRAAPEPARAHAAFRAWVERAGGVVEGFRGDATWAPARRFARLWERLALPGLGRDARYELLVLAGRLGLVELEESTLGVGGDDEVTRAAKRAFGIGDPLLLERRARALVDAAAIPLAALDLALCSWERGARVRTGFTDDVMDIGARERLSGALGLEDE